MVKLLLQGVGCICGCMVLYAGLFGVLVLVSECDGYDPYTKLPVEDAVIDGLEAAGKAEVAARLSNSLPPVLDNSTDF